MQNAKDRAQGQDRPRSLHRAKQIGLGVLVDEMTLVQSKARYAKHGEQQRDGSSENSNSPFQLGVFSPHFDLRIGIYGPYGGRRLLPLPARHRRPRNLEVAD